MEKEYKLSAWELMQLRFDMWAKVQRERMVMRIAWKLPRWLAYWAFIRVAAHGTTGVWGNTHPDTLSVIEAMKRWDQKPA